MSGDYSRILKRRAEAMMKNAIRLYDEGEYDLAVLNAEYAAQLYVKAALYQLSGEEWRGHGVRSLLGVLAFIAREGGLEDVANKLHDFVRSILAELDEAHTRAIYGVFEYTKEQAGAIIDISREAVDLIKGILELLK